MDNKPDPVAAGLSPGIPFFLTQNFALWETFRLLSSNAEYMNKNGIGSNSAAATTIADIVNDSNNNDRDSLSRGENIGKWLLPNKIFF